MTLGLEVVSGDGVGDDEDFPHDSDEGDLSGPIVVVGDAIVEVAHRGGMADSGAGGVEQGAAHERSSMTDFGLPFSFSAFVGVGARPTRAAICFPLRRPSSGKSAMSVAATTGPTPRTARKTLASRSRLGVSAGMTKARLSRTNGSFARSTRQSSACRASTSCLRRAASARRRSSARETSPAGRRALWRQRDSGRSAWRRSDRSWRARREPCERRGWRWGGA